MIPSRALRSLVLACLALACTTHPAEEPDSGAALTPVNATCPRSGLPVSADSLTEYRGRVVGFCNPHCRDDFAANADERPADRMFFDTLLDGTG